MMITIKKITACDDALIKLVKQFRDILNNLNQTKAQSIEAAKLEAESYFQTDRTVLAAYDKETLLGFIVLKSSDGVFWVEWLYVDSKKRRRGIASKLFQAAEAHVHKAGEEKLYIWVHPDNETMLKFLARHGYDALNLIEVTKKSQTKGKTVTRFDHPLKY